MSKGPKKYSLCAFLLLLFVIVLQVSGQKAQGVVQEADGEILSFEKSDVIAKIRSSKSIFQQTNTISLLGTHSLRWNWTRGASLSLPLFNYYSERVRISPFDKDQCLVIWVFNESPSSGAITLTLEGNELAPISSEFYLDFTGWRTAHIPLSQMNGAVPQKGDFNHYQWLKLNVSKSHPEKKGRFFIDDVYTTMMDARHPSADFQAPYVRAFYNGGAHVTQWMNQKELPSRSDLVIKQIPVSGTDLNSFDKLYKNEFHELTKGLIGKGLSNESYERVLQHFQRLRIKEVREGKEKFIQGPYIALKGQGLPTNVIDENMKTGRLVEVKQFEGILYSIVQSFIKSTDKKQQRVLKECFILATKAYLKSGWAAGSNMGALHHYGYSSRKIAPSFFMMKKELKSAGLLDEVSASLNWYAVSHVVNNETHTMPDLDLFNTLLYSHYLASMMWPDKKDATRHAILLSRWMSRTFADDTKHGGFQHDGTAWHHWGHYPAYCKGAIDDAVRVANKLTNAGFPLTSKGHQALQKAVKTILLYSQGDCIPRSLSGRHPLTGSHKNFIEAAYTKDFVNTSPVDPELLKLYQSHISKDEINGHWTLPYSALNIHRRANYLATVRGFGIYSWGSEIYNFNRFGRYQSYGTLDIIYSDDQQLAYEGYDWNLNPGTTITYLPLKELESPIPIFMVKSFSRFANGVHDKEGKNGAHGFILDESMLLNIDPEYEEIITNEKLMARKSTFFMDDIIVCLGSGISGQHQSAPVYTVLTQKPMSDKHNILLGKKEINNFPFKDEIKGRTILYDGENTGYVVLNIDASLKIEMKEQVSRGDECTFDETRRPPRSKSNEKVNIRREPYTKGNFLSAVIEHGVKPVDERYSYAVLPGKDQVGFTAQANDLLDHPELYYHIISHRNKLHALRDVRNQTETYICYEAQDMIPHAGLHEVSDPCLIIFKALDEKTQSVSVALPDLHQDAFSREQKHKQWMSRQHELRLTFDGDWELSEDSANIKVESEDGRTIIVVEAQHGVSNHFTIKKTNRSFN